MHVTIALLTHNKHDHDHWEEDEVFSRNSGKFDDGVEEFYGKARDEAIDEVCKLLGEALVGRGTEKVDGGESLWIEVDPDKTDALFMRPWSEFVEALRKTHAMSLQSFMDGDSSADIAVQRLREAYDFDWMYVLSEYGDAKPVSEWLRELRKDAKESPGVRRFYLHAVYDGNQ